MSAAQKFAALDRDVGELRQFLQQQDQGNMVLVDQLATDIKAKVADIESSFAQGSWVELIGKEVEKHAGALVLLAGQASTVDRHVQGRDEGCEGRPEYGSWPHPRIGIGSSSSSVQSYPGHLSGPASRVSSVRCPTGVRVL